MSKWLVLVLWLIAFKSLALQNRVAEEGVALDFDISQEELTQIIIEDDRITGVKSATDSLAIEREETLGHLFIKPYAPTFVERPIQLFLITEQGRTIGLRLTPEDIPTETIKIQSGDEPAPQQSALVSQQNIVTDLILALHHHTNIEGYTFSKDAQEPLTLPKLTACETARLVGSQWIAIEYIVHNPHRRPVQLWETNFYTPNVKGVAIENKTLSKNQSTRVYVVKEW